MTDRNFKVRKGIEVSEALVLSSSNSLISLSGALQFAGTNSNRFQINALGTDLVLSSSGPANGGGRTIISGSLVIPKGGGINGAGQGLAIGANVAFEALYIVDGNVHLQGAGETQFAFKRTGLTNNPVFKIGRLITAGDGSPEMRILYSDDVTTERSICEFDNKGIFASVKPAVGSHWEGFITGNVQPHFRLNSYPSMSLEMGAGSSTGLTWTDVILRRGDQGRLRIISQLSGGTETTASLDISNIYHSLGHLILSSSAGSVTTLSSALDIAEVSKPYHIRSVNSSLILSSTFDSIIVASSSLVFPNIDKNYHIRSVNGNLIFSATVGNTVTVSASLEYIGTLLAKMHPAATSVGITFKNATNSNLGFISTDSAGLHVDTSGFNRGINLSNTKVRIGAAVSAASPLIETLDISGSILLQQPDRAIIYATGSHLILSSSVNGSSTTVSGALRLAPVFASTALPSTDITSGSFVYLSDKKCFAIYTPEGWMRLISGTL